MLARTDPCHRIQSINGLNTAGGKTPWNLLTCRSVHLDESSGFCAGDRTKWWLQQAARIIKSTLQTRVSSPNVNQFKSKQQYWLAMKKRAWLLQMLSYIFTGLSFHVSTLACVQINFFFLFFCLFKQAASVVPPSAFAQYKGELIISLKFVTPKKQTAEKTKGKKKVAVSISGFASNFWARLFSRSDKKARVEEGGELHVLIKEAKNLMAMKSGGTSDSFVKGLVITCPILKPIKNK